MEIKELLIPSIIAVSTLGILACLLALCTLCRRKYNKRALLQDGVQLVDAPVPRSTEPSEPATKPPKLKRADSKGKQSRSASFNLHLPLREDDGTTSVSSFTILTQRQLPQIPSEDLPGPEETYSNLTFPSPSHEVFYESVAVTGGEKEQPSLIEAEEGLPQGPEAQTSRAEYACVLKLKKKEEPSEMEAGGSRGTSPQQPRLAKTEVNLPTVKVEEMYSVVNKAGKKKKADSEEDREESPRHVEISHPNGQLAAVHQEPESRAEPQTSSSLSPVKEPCYDSVSHEPWVRPNGREVIEPAYESVDTLWKPPRTKGKANPNKQAENLYESI